MQPDLILQLARRIAEDRQRELGHPVEVRADTRVSLDGRVATRLVAPAVDLAREHDGLAARAWILPEPGGPPPMLRPVMTARAEREETAERAARLANMMRT